MPRYRATATLFVAGSRIRPGREFVSDLPPAPQWELLDPSATVEPAPEVVDPEDEPPEDEPPEDEPPPEDSGDV
jgi:hypothetical protein